MKFLDQTRNLRYREAPLEMHSDSFREVGHQLVDAIAEFLQLGYRSAR